MSAGTDLPGSMKEALQGPDSQKWKDSALEELQNHQKQDT